MSRLYIDHSETIHSGLNTGIQRVVRNIVARKDVFIKHDFESATNVVQLDGRYYPVDCGETLPSLFRDALHRCAVQLRRAVDCLFRAAGREVSSAPGAENPLSEDSTASSSCHGQVVLFFRRVLGHLFSAAHRLDRLLLNRKPVVFGPGDVLFLPDAFWGASCRFEAILMAKAGGAKVVPLFYDLIPITHPEMCDAAYVSAFTRDLPELIPLMDAYVCISNYTCGEVHDYLRANHKASAYLPSAYFHLGSDFAPVDEEAVGTTDLHGSRYYLAVGTVEPRKNYGFMLDSFERYWDNGGSANLVVVGKVGWCCDDIVQRFRGSKYAGQKLFWYEGVSDSVLAGLYGKAIALVFASIIEGFGLPLVEAMFLNKPVFASGIPIFREVAKEYPHYFDLSDPDSLLHLLKTFEGRAIDQNIKSPTVLSWDDSVESLAFILARLFVTPGCR